MKNYFLICLLIIILSIGCTKEEPIDLSYLCTKGDLWLIDRADSFNPNHSLDSFKFNQGAGHHSFVFTNSYVNRLQIDVLAKPDSGQTMVYKKQFVKAISGSFILQGFTFDNKLDSVLTITNNGTHYLIDIKTIAVNISANTTKDLRACSLKMTDVLP